MRAKLYHLPIICLAILLLSSIAPIAVQAQSNNINSTTFAELSYNDMRLQGLHGSTGLWIPFQSDWVTAGDLQLELTYIGSPLLNPDTAIVTIIADNREITSFRPQGDGREKTVTLTIPQPPSPATGVNLTFAGHLRLTDDPCEDSFNIGQWLVIRNNSRITIDLAGSTAPSPQLTDLPEVIFVQGSDAPPPVIFVLPEEADDVTLTAAAQVASRLGKGVNANHMPIRVETAVSLTEADKANANLIIVGLRDNHSLIEELSPQMPVPPRSRGFVSQDGVFIPDDDGVVQIFNSPWHTHRHILLISGNSAAGLAQAGQAFADQPTFQSLTGSFHFIDSLIDRPEPMLPPPWTTAQTTFAQLGETNRNVVGLGIIDTYYFLRHPPGVILGDNAQLMLHVAFSPALKTQNAYTEVYLNDIYVGAVEATRVGGDAWVALDLPAQALNQLKRSGTSREIELKLSVANLLPVNNCEPVNADSSWTKIYADSFWQFSYQPVGLPDLHVFPYPFIGLDNETPVRVVIPENPTSAELQTTLSLAAWLGNRAIQDWTVDVVQNTAVSPEILANHQLILLGTTSNNPALQQIADTAEIRLPGDVYQMYNAPQVGFFHTMTSPWDDNMTALAIYGQSQVGFQTAAQAFYERGWLVSEPGSLAIVRHEQEPEIVYRELVIQPQPIQPDLVVSEISQQGVAAAAEPTTTAPAPNPYPAPAQTEEIDVGPTGLSNTERIILIITAFLVVLVTVATLLRIAWRIRA